ncbi:DNA-3-methyladenine glycosylase [Nocardioides sp. CFH 31398]|uniref:DNA-3-methyladenine glycosylase family protein n=1 Tax=Nocardioides sp. CFH 31398 TaxID=2919579 RepID=UPI001F05199C|nr:DNA-3-methyladenine glycosylase 2 family protein [Nocardioides sp. CFH 31398]MCH1866704.1 DNA-3-methyladenine glycosylase 2 family protein [Nocardioides sp. CFH 31398]
MDRGRRRVWRPDWPCPVALNLRILKRGSDAAFRIDPDGTVWRGIRTPEGPATLVVRARDALGEVHAAAWGDGADWALTQLPAMCGAEDDPSGFVPEHPVVVEAWRRHEHWRLTRTGLVFEALLPAILEQKVTGKQAFAAQRLLARRYGERAPGPGAEHGLWVPPTPAVVASIPSWEWLRMGVDPARSKAAVRAARVADSLERLVDVDHAEADRRLRTLPGVGVWTSAEVRFRALGDADAVSFGDYHIAKNVTWALTGTVGDDDDMAALLQPFRPHRHRVQRLVELAHLSRPRRGPRLTLPTHLPG